MTQTPAIKMDVQLSKEFKKMYRKADPKVRSAFLKRLELFMEDPYHPLLKNHKLTGRYRGMRSINVTGDWRAMYLEVGQKHGLVQSKEVIIFRALGTHSQLYK